MTCTHQMILEAVWGTGTPGRLSISMHTSTDSARNSTMVPAG